MKKDIDLKNFKKISSDKYTSTFRHKDGHQLKVSHIALSPGMRKKLDSLPVSMKMARGGDIPESLMTNEDYEASQPAEYVANVGQPEEEVAGNEDIQPETGVPADQSGPGGLNPEQQDNSLLDYGDKLPEQGKQPSAESVPNQGLAPNGTPNALMTDKQQANAQMPQQAEAAQPQEAYTPPAAPKLQATPQAKAPVADKSDPIATSNEMKSEDKAWQQDLNNGHITPETYSSLFAKKDTLGKIRSIFGLLLSGMGSGLSHQPNAFLEIMNNELNKDFEAQKQSKSNALDFRKLSMQHELQKYQIKNINSEIANRGIDTQIKVNAEARARQTRAAVHDLTLLVNSLPPGSQQRANAEQKLAFVSQAADAQNADLMDRAAGAMAMYNMGSNGEDPSSAIRFKVPPDKQKEVAEDIDKAKETKRIAPDILKAFDDAASHKGIIDLVPGMKNADQKKFLSLINTTVKETEGTARQAAFKSLEDNMMPQAFDMEATAKKREALVDYLKKNSDSALAKTYGIDLNKYKTTNKSDIGEPIKTVNGIQYKRGPDGKAIRVK